MIVFIVEIMMSNGEIYIKLLRIEKTIRKYRNNVTNIDHILTIDICSDYYKHHGTYNEQFRQLHKKCVEIRDLCDKILSKFNGIRIDNETADRFDEYRKNLKVELDEIEKEFNIISNDFHKYKLKRMNNGEIR